MCDYQESSVIIERANNGYIVTYPSPNTGFSCVEVVEQGASEVDSAKTIQRLLWVVQEAVGYFPSKHNKENCLVVIQENKE